MKVCFIWFIGTILLLGSNKTNAQRYLTDMDTSLFNRDTVSRVVKRFENIYISGYMQPQFQAAQSKGSPAFGGGDFDRFTNNRFMLRRARVKLDYVVPGKLGDFPAALFTFQFEATERDVNVRDVFVRIFEPKEKNLSLTAGLFSRPFGFEVNLSSGFRETPERGRMSQILMPSERDLGVMITLNRKKPTSKIPIKWDAGIFNGQGKSGPKEFDSYKDIISRLTFKPFSINKSDDLLISGGLSILYGAYVQATRYKYEMAETVNGKFFMVDSSIDNIGDKLPRHYYGADVQLVKKHNWGKTEIRGEYWRGTQTGLLSSTENPGDLPDEPAYVRNFDGAFIYLLQNIINSKWEIMAKYDFYDPNTDVQEQEIGAPGTNLSPTDILYHTIGVGFTHYFTPRLKVLAYYDIVRNEKTMLPGYTTDRKDNIFTCRLQMRF